MSDMSARTSTWKGLNRMPFIKDGEMRNMKNLSSDGYPYLTTRKGRKPYTFPINIPATPGNGYVADVTVLPDNLTEDDQGKIYKLVGEFEAGSFYKYDGEKWSKDESISVVSEILGSETGYSTLLSSDCRTKPYERPYESKTTEEKKAEKLIGTTVKYIGDTNDFFEKNKVYVYGINGWYEWGEVGGQGGYDVAVDEKEDLPKAAKGLVGKKYLVRNDKYYKCFRYWQGEWTETKGYAPTNQKPDNPKEGDIIFWCGESIVVNGSYYMCVKDGKYYYYTKAKASTKAEEVNILPSASSENKGNVYLYTGASTGGFAQWVYENGELKWKSVSEPKVYKDITISEYFKEYEEHPIEKIVEIASFRGSIAALIRNTKGEYKLFYDKKTWSINNITEESGKKLINVGNRLIVGESGSYLYFETTKENDTITKKLVFNKAGEVFAVEVSAHNFDWGNGGEKTKEWQAYGEREGNSKFLLYAAAGKGALLKNIAEGLKKEGTNFSVYSKKKGIAHRQYLKVKSVSFEENKLIGGWTTGTTWYEEYADVLEIRATGAWEDFDWYSESGDKLVFESTDPHYYDVTAWKKRLWGYYDNVLTGTAADIFDDKGNVDWNRGGNTNSEAITQPLWQGGDITGLAALVNGLVYFKENFISVVQGNYPAIMSSNTIPCKGLPPENRRSIAVLKESVYYLSTDGVYRFDGGIPSCISREARITGSDAVGGADGNKYYISLKENSGDYALYVYDINYDVWHKEDNIHCTSFTMHNGEMHLSAEDEIYNISFPQEDVEWECELWYDEGTEKPKKYKSFKVRGNVGTDCEMFLKADDGEWQLVHACDNKLDVKISPFDAEELGIRIKGKGICEIKSLERIFEVR